MRHLEIYHLGPIKHVQLNLKKYNFFIGPQSAGKSCVLKTLAHCAWVEKTLMVTRYDDMFRDEDYFFSQLLLFHNMKGYEQEDTRIMYNSSFLTISYDRSKKENERFSCKIKNLTYKFKRPKLSYIPAERNIVSVVPNPMGLSLPKNNIMDFISEWDIGRKQFTNKSLTLVDIPVSYHYDDASKSDQIMVEGGKPIGLAETSSGVQALVPLMVHLTSLLNGVYDNDLTDPASVQQNRFCVRRLYKNKIKLKGSTTVQSRVAGDIYHFNSKTEFELFKEIADNYTTYRYSDIYIEEPEENLFPETQRGLLYSILKEIKVGDHLLTIATHSPYILYSLNNCMLAYMVQKVAPAEDLKNIPIINPKDVGVWQIKSGELYTVMENYDQSIQDERGLIRSNFFDTIMKGVMRDFSNLIDYLD